MLMSARTASRRGGRTPNQATLGEPADSAVHGRGDVALGDVEGLGFTGG